MKTTHLIAALSLVLSLSACKKKDAENQPSPAPAPAQAPAEGTPKPAEPPAAPAKPAKAGRAIPNSSGLIVDAPAKWLDNGIGGAAGMHLDGDAGMFMVRETAPEEAAKTLAQWKKETEEMLFQKWLSADAIADGFKALYVMDKIEMKGDEPKKVGSVFAFHVRRKIGDKVHDCYGSTAAKETAQEAAELCMKVDVQ